jgi:hypothetical protein
MERRVCLFAISRSAKKKEDGKRIPVLDDHRPDRSAFFRANLIFDDPIVNNKMKTWIIPIG